MDLNERKKYTLKQLGFKVKTKKSCDPKWFNEIKPGSMHHELFVKETQIKESEKPGGW